MIIIPERKMVLLLVPRTGTRALKAAVAERYPESFMIYRHMEADGVPQGYDRWQKVGVVRHPVDRLWSLYKYLARFGVDFCQEHDETYAAGLRASVSRPFEDWLMHNQMVFTSPYDSAGLGRFFPAYTCRHPIPENRKSQFVYIRPDLGTQIYAYQDVSHLHDDLGIKPARVNGTSDAKPPALSPDARAYVERWFAWDLAVVGAALRSAA